MSDKNNELKKLCNDIIKNNNLYWQYPVITEKTANKQMQNIKGYIGLPWATIIDKKLNIKNIHDCLKKYIDKDKSQTNFITCCQHISFKKLIPLLKNMGITTVYASHKIINENVINNIKIHACPLYAVNYEDVKRNAEFKNVNFIKNNRKILYSFMGGYTPCYLTNIRKKIFEMNHPKNTFIKSKNNWHFDNIVYKYQVQNIKLTKNDIQSDINGTRLYNELLLKSRYSLCPSGTGPNSIRLWESLAVGTIPIILADTLDLPPHPLWKKSIIRLEEKDLNDLNKILNNITPKTENEMRKNCINIYNYFCNNFCSV